jgi:hypothetical protein
MSKLLATRADGFLYLAFAASISVIITGLVLYLLDEATGTVVILIGMVTNVFSGGIVDWRAWRRLKREGYPADSLRLMTLVRFEFWTPTALRHALALTSSSWTIQEVLRALLAPPGLAFVLVIAVKVLM